MWINIKTIVEEHVSSENVYQHSTGRWFVDGRHSYVSTINKQTSLHKPTSKLKLLKE